MSRRLAIFLVFVVLLAVVYGVSHRHLTWDTLVESEADLRAWLAEHPGRGFVVCFAVYVAVSLVPGTTGKAIIAGWLFGFWRGLVLVNVGLTAAALASFCVSRFLCHDLVASRLGARLARANAALEREGASYLFAARVLHTPFCVTNYVMGVTRIPLRSFWWATQLGTLPGNVVFVYAGAQAPSLAELSERGLASLLSPGLVVAFVLMSVLPLYLRSLVHRMLSRARHRKSG